jgi:DNA repair photolyase
LEVLLPRGFAPVILTRAARILDDLELLRRFPRAAVGLSIPTDDDHYRALFEPGADPIDDRIAALAGLHAAGLRTFVVIQPMLPMLPERLVERVAPYVHAARIDRMHERERMVSVYFQHGLEDAATDAFFERTERSLRDAFAARGVPLDDLDDLAPILGPAA